MLGSAKGALAVAQSAVVELGSVEENGESAATHDHLGSIQSTGRKRAARQSSRAGHQSLGRRRTVTESGAMAGKLGTYRCLGGEEKQGGTGGEESKGERGRHRGGLILIQAVGGGAHRS
jgi:hypothetical protein